MSSQILDRDSSRIIGAKVGEVSAEKQDTKPKTSMIVTIQADDAIFVTRNDLVTIYKYLNANTKQASELSRDAWEEQSAILELVMSILGIPGAESLQKYPLIEPKSDEVAERIITSLLSRRPALAKRFLDIATKSQSKHLEVKIAELDNKVRVLRLEKKDIEDALKAREEDVKHLELAVRELSEDSSAKPKGRAKSS